MFLQLPGAIKTLHNPVLICEVLLDFLAHVKDRAILAGTQDILMKRALAPLTLGPKA
eukprot:m.351109 g.351109  ORF g.351109 m.351109 type:complete len:57 (-) comp16170_c1_seq1:3119-3289(-)